MKAEYIYLTDLTKLGYALGRIESLEVGNKYMITISNAGDKTRKQRGYQWRLYTDISKAGIGGELEETPQGVDLACKYRFALAIFMRDDSFFSELYDMFSKSHNGDKEHLKWFVKHQVHTENFNTSQMAEYITMIINFYAPKGVQLTDPSEYGLK